MGAEAGSMNLADETIAYQALLEGHRRDPDNEELWQDCVKAKGVMEVAWITHTHRRSPSWPASSTATA